MNVILYYYALYKTNKLDWFTQNYGSKIIDFNGKEYSDIIYLEEAKVISNKKNHYKMRNSWTQLFCKQVCWNKNKIIFGTFQYILKIL